MDSGNDKPDPRARRLLDEVFGDVLPDTTADERDSTSDEHDRRDWYERNRPPHHE